MRRTHSAPEAALDRHPDRGGTEPGDATARRTLRGLVASFAALLAAAALAVVPAGVANADAELKCSAKKDYYIAHLHGETTVQLQSCIYANGDKRGAAFVDIEWLTNVEPDDWGSIYHSFKFQVRTEKNNVDKKVIRCDFTEKLNWKPFPDELKKCPSREITGTGTGWSADGRIEYDVVGDGHGKYIEPVDGSPEI